MFARVHKNTCLLVNRVTATNVFCLFQICKPSQADNLTWEAAVGAARPRGDLGSEKLTHRLGTVAIVLVLRMTYYLLPSWPVRLVSRRRHSVSDRVTIITHYVPSDQCVMWSGDTILGDSWPVPHCARYCPQCSHQYYQQFDECAVLWYLFSRPASPGWVMNCRS